MPLPSGSPGPVKERARQEAKSGIRHVKVNWPVADELLSREDARGQLESRTSTLQTGSLSLSGADPLQIGIGLSHLRVQLLL